MKKKIEKKVWMHKYDFNNCTDAYVTYKEEPKNNNCHVLVTMSTEMDCYAINLIKGPNGYHLSQPELEGRMPFDKFIELIKKLKKLFTHKINFLIYSNQPVFEFEVSNSSLTVAIEDIIGNVEVTCEEE